VAAVHRARLAVLAQPGRASGGGGRGAGAGVAAGWLARRDAGRHTDLAEGVPSRADRGGSRGVGEGEEGHRAAGVYLTRPAGHRKQVWEMDHKQLPILVMPPRGAACCSWLTTVIDDATRVLAGWAIALTPHAGTVLTAVRMALLHDRARGPFGAIPAQGGSTVPGVRRRGGPRRVRRAEHRPAAAAVPAAGKQYWCTVGSNCVVFVPAVRCPSARASACRS
jgi:putative transposase